MAFSERLYDSLRDKEIGWVAAKALGEIVESDAILTKANHADVKVKHIVRTQFHGLQLSIQGSLCPEIRQHCPSQTCDAGKRR